MTHFNNQIQQELTLKRIEMTDYFWRIKNDEENSQSIVTVYIKLSSLNLLL